MKPCVGARRIFSRGGQIKGRGRKSPSGVQGVNLSGGMGRISQKPTKVVKIMHN